MEVNEILNKIAELKELAKKVEDLAFEIHGDVVAKKIEARDAMNDCLRNGKDIDKVEYLNLSQQSIQIDEIASRIETATYCLTKEVIGNLDKIA